MEHILLGIPRRGKCNKLYMRGNPKPMPRTKEREISCFWVWQRFWGKVHLCTYKKFILDVN
jgi:hypothetical protein